MSKVHYTSSENKLFSKKKKLSKFLFISTCLLGGIAASMTPLFLTSCSQTQSLSTSFRVVNMNVKTQSNNINPSINIKDLNEIVNVSPKDLVKGSNSFNDGKYIIIYGTIGYKINSLKLENGIAHWDITNSSSFYKWLIGATSSNGIDQDEQNRFNDFQIANNFFNYWFNDSTLSQYKNVKIALFIDKPPYPSDDAALTPETYCPADPFEKWDQSKILTLYEYQSKKPSNSLQFSELPENWKMLEGTYMRNDESAKIYRELVNYSNDLRNGVQSVDGGGDNKNSGMIAFNGANKNPMTTSLPLDDYKTNFEEGATSNAPDSWKKIYKFYTGDDWPE